MTERVIFVDIDGVLFPEIAWEMPENAPLLANLTAESLKAIRFRPEAVSLLVRLADLSGAKLVLSSNWRRTWPHGIDALRTKLEQEGLRPDLWHGDWILPVTGRGKGNEIADWIDYYGPEKALIIDDEGYDGPGLPIGAAGIVMPAPDEGYCRADHWAACGFFDIEDTEDAAVPENDEPAGAAEIALEAPPVLKTAAERFADGEIDCKPIGEFLFEHGCDDVPPGLSRLWYNRGAEKGATWMYATAPEVSGAAKAGYDVILAYGEDNDDVEVRVTALLASDTATGRCSSLRFRKANAIMIRDGKMVAAGAMTEAMVIGKLSGQGFGSSPFRFESSRF